jgi:hypothetical protein
MVVVGPTLVAGKTIVPPALDAFFRVASRSGTTT